MFYNYTNKFSLSQRSIYLLFMYIFLLIVSENYSVPRGTNAIIMPYFVHRQEQLYPDSETFNPNRFLNVENVNRHPFMYIPFSGGPRNCIGM